MKNYLDSIDGMLLRTIRLIGREADKRKLPVYLVGGIVRDILLKKPNLDLDIVVEGKAETLAHILSRKLNARLTVHKKFGTASLQLPGRTRVDCAQAREEIYKHSGALPSVRLGKLKNDLYRRDFTINAMAIAINGARLGQLVDPYGGRRDLSAQKIRVLHALSFEDDPTRIARAVRFEQRYRFQIDRWTFGLIKKAIQGKGAKNVTPQRYWNELKKILSETNPLNALKRFKRMGWLPLFGSRFNMPLSGLSRVHQGIQKMKIKMADERNVHWWLVYFLGMIVQCPSRLAKDILSETPMTKHERNCVRQSLNFARLLKDLSAKDLPASRVYQLLNPLHKEVIVFLYVRTPNRLIKRRITRYVGKDAGVYLQVNGGDIQKMGVPSGRNIGKILNQLLLLKIDQKIRTRRDELHYAKLYATKS